MSKLITKNDLKGILNQVLPVDDDSNWIVLTPTSDFIAYSAGAGDQCRCRKIGNIVNVCGVMKPTAARTAANMGTEIPICTLPSGYWPPVDLVSLHQGSGNAVWMSRIRAEDGQVMFARYRDFATTTGSGYTATTTTSWLPFNITFLTAEGVEKSGAKGGGGGSVDSTPIPTASKVSEFDSNAKMNSTDMSSDDVSAFVSGLNTGVSDYVQRSEMPMYMPAWAQIYAANFTANNTSTQVTGTTVTYSDNASEYFTLGTDQITIKKAGLYKITIAWILTSATNNTNVKRITLYKNGAESFAVLGRDSSYENRSSIAIQSFAVGDILTMWKRAEDNNSTFGHGRIFIETLRPAAQ